MLPRHPFNQEYIVAIFADIAALTAKVGLERLIELTDDARSGVVDVGLAEKALTEADNIINGYIAAHYKRADAALPIPPLLTQIAIDIAYFRLYRFSAQPEHIAAAYKEACDMLKRIASGLIKLDGGEEVLPVRDGAILFESDQPIFGRTNMAGF
jgi:phage gp36-like protein